MKLTIGEAATRVAKGVEFLDEYRPNWRASVDSDRLVMSKPKLCILGQTFGDYWDAIHQFGMGYAEQEHRGFTLHAVFESVAEDREAWATLDQAWREELARVNA